MPWQDAVALLIVVAAAAYLARVAWSVMMRRKAGGCGGCGSCPSGAETSADGKPLVTLNPPSKRQ